MTARGELVRDSRGQLARISSQRQVLLTSFTLLDTAERAAGSLTFILPTHAGLTEPKPIDALGPSILQRHRDHVSELILGPHARFLAEMYTMQGMFASHTGRALSSNIQCCWHDKRWAPMSNKRLRDTS